ncbi:MAG TPA: hypothetical protein VH307_02330 [Streptosporangiaceae bacterium]|nr:hypothetical protein [Streptosporangiaceae bacterium]
MLQAELADDHGQPDDRGRSVSVRDRSALIEVQVPAGAIVMYQRRARRVLDEQSVQALGSGGVIPLGGGSEDRAEFVAEYPERIKIVMSAWPAQMRVVGHERAEGVGGAELVSVAVAVDCCRVHKAHSQPGIGREIHCDP